MGQTLVDVSTPSKPNLTKISGVVKVAIDAMVWQGLPRKQAAEVAKISEHGLYKALCKPPVKAYYNAQLEVLRSSERARNVHRLREIRDAGNNMPAVQAIGMLERMSDEATADKRAQHVLQSPGLTIVISQAAPAALPDPKVIDHE
jgi:hypothetical protein